MELVALEQKMLSQWREEERAKGCLITRTTQVFEVGDRKKAKQWTGLQTYIQVKRSIIHLKTQEVTYETAYFISDLILTAKAFHVGIRAHWGIENRLHWVKDVTHNEDNNKIRLGNGPLNASLFSSIAINIHRKNGNDSISQGQMIYAANLKDFIHIVRT